MKKKETLKETVVSKQSE